MIQDIAPRKLYNEFVPGMRALPDDTVIHFRGKEMLVGAGTELICLPAVKDLVLTDEERADLRYLFRIDDENFFALTDAEAKLKEPERFEYLPLARIREEKTGPDYLMLAAYTGCHLCGWYRDNRFCGSCGSPTHTAPDERALDCPKCRRRIYPRIVPAVIVGVTSGDRLLVTRYANRPFTQNALVAGFTEIGETLEETVARDFLLHGGAEAVVVVCDAGCLERNLNLALQCRELCKRVLVCVNLLDEAQRRGILVDCGALSRELGVPVIGIVARERGCRDRVLAALDALMAAPEQPPPALPYPPEIRAAMERLLPIAAGERFPAPWLCIQLLAGETLPVSQELQEAAGEERAALGLDRDALEDRITDTLVREGERLCRGAVSGRREGYSAKDARLDRVLTGRWLAFPVLLLLLLAVFYITIRGANVPSEWLGARLSELGELLRRGLEALDAPPWLTGLLLDGAYRSLSLVVSVMLPPMAIFFPLFTLLEDAGYLPRVAYNLDRPFQCCRACGKQSLCMMMGLGCNAVGVTGCRIIDSPRERLLAVLTNGIMPCNGRFPLLIALLTLFFTPAGGSPLGPALGLTLVIAGSVAATFAVTALLSRTLLRGQPSAFVLELPPYRRPQIGKVLLRSVLDRTLFVLGRAAAVAAPAGALLWLLGHVQLGGESLLLRCAGALDPAGRFFGLDGAILLAFLLGLPANETVLPILLMIYGAGGTLGEVGALSEVHALLLQNG